MKGIKKKPPPKRKEKASEFDGNHSHHHNVLATAVDKSAPDGEGQKGRRCWLVVIWRAQIVLSTEERGIVLEDTIMIMSSDSSRSINYYSFSSVFLPTGLFVRYTALAGVPTMINNNDDIVCLAVSTTAAPKSSAPRFNGGG